MGLLGGQNRSAGCHDDDNDDGDADNEEDKPHCPWAMGLLGGAILKYRCAISDEVLASRYAHLFSHTKYWVVFMHQDGSGQDDD